MIAKGGSGWWEEFYSGLCLEYVRQARDEEQTRAELAFIRAAMGLPTRARVLDVPCGAGRLALEMAAWGHDVTAVDQSAELIEAARRDASQRSLAVDWQRGDMRNLPEDGSYDGAVCLWNSFGYFDDAGNLEFLRAVSRSLKPGGQLALDTPLLETLLLDAVQEPRVWEQAGELLALEERGYDHETGRLASTWTFIGDGRREVRDMSMRLYTYRELTAMLEQAGFGLHQAYGDLDMTPFELGAPWLYLVTTRLGERRP
ncbi:MAG: class I SAM-dependent methyltransferase [Chloroflexota bacterium]|nr:class I SAM-dependent methyltransferase [Chloroflexota bacterium]MDE2958734.1 class I SAM-dependent methyltransferase [Chloroflexota bacterium]